MKTFSSLPIRRAQCMFSDEQYTNPGMSCPSDMTTPAASPSVLYSSPNCCGIVWAHAPVFFFQGVCLSMIAAADESAAATCSCMPLCPCTVVRRAVALRTAIRGDLSCFLQIWDTQYSWWTCLCLMWACGRSMSDGSADNNFFNQRGFCLNNSYEVCIRRCVVQRPSACTVR